MEDHQNRTNITIDGTCGYQRIDGFGVNINSKYWDDGALKPVMDLLVDDLGATLFRVDIYGNSNWVDPDGTLGCSALNDDTLKAVYKSPVFESGWAMMKYLNTKGIHPYLTASGAVPTWMLGSDGKTLTQYDQFSTMMVSLVKWAKQRKGINFNLFGPINETDQGMPEGPTLGAEGYAEAVAVLDKQLRQAGLDDIRLVVAEQAWFDTSYVNAFIAHEELAGRIGVFGMHNYFDMQQSAYDELHQTLKGTAYGGLPIWMSEYGDLDLTGELEWHVSKTSTRRLLSCLQNGFNGAMVWDAYDNYHDHDKAWTIYGLIRRGGRLYTPKKRYYAAKQVYRFVRPGFERISMEGCPEGLTAFAFTDALRRNYAIVGQNDSGKAQLINIKLNGFSAEALSGKAKYYRTSENENCVLVEETPVTSSKSPCDGLCVRVPPDCIFTLTNN